MIWSWWYTPCLYFLPLTFYFLPLDMPTSPKEFKPSKKDIKSAPDRIADILDILAQTYPDARCELDYKTPLQLMVATILSAQCTDKRVNEVTKDLFKKYKKAADYAAADVEAFGEDIKSTGFFRNKAKNIIAACQSIVENHSGKVPATMDQLVKLPGVGRKTANVILGNAFDVPGITTDTHMIRLSRLIGLSANIEPEKLEADLCKLIPNELWTIFSHRIIWHGRRICNARKPDCQNCPLTNLCCYHRS